MLVDHQERERIRGSREGRSEAFADLVREHQQMIHALTYRMTGSVSDSEDLAQETFIRAWGHMDEFAGSSKFSTWLCGIAVHACLNWRKREGRRAEVHQSWAQESLLRDGEPDPSEASGVNTRVQEALNRLPPKQRAAITLTVYHDMNHAEAAKALGCTEATISWRVFAARRKLRKWLKRRSPDE